MRNEDDILDEISRLVDDQLEAGDQSDSYYGSQYRQEQPCPWCSEGWHFLPITVRMQEMRAGAYAVDEFGQGIVDPDYSYRTDDSGIICPGSEYHGPMHKTRTWDKQSRERAEKRTVGAYAPYAAGDPAPYLPPGELRKLRFTGPFEPWVIAVNEEREILDSLDPTRPREIRSHTLTVTFDFELPIVNPSREWLETNLNDISHFDYHGSSLHVRMAQVVVPFANMELHAADMSQDYPDWLEFETTYRIENHPWMMSYWEVHEPDIVILDEAHTFTNEELRGYVDQIQEVRRTLATEAQIPPGFFSSREEEEEADEEER